MPAALAWVLAIVVASLLQAHRHVRASRQLGNALIALAVSAFSLLTRLFLAGGLRPNERESIGEHIRWDVTETCLALTIFRSELDVATAVQFLGLVLLKWCVARGGGRGAASARCRRTVRAPRPSVLRDASHRLLSVFSACTGARKSGGTTSA